MSLLPVPPLAAAAVAAVASRGWTTRRRATIAIASFLACLSVAWRSADPIEGSVLVFVALMAAACCLVFVLPPRPELAPRAVWLGWTTAALAWLLAGGRP